MAWTLISQSENPRLLMRSPASLARPSDDEGSLTRRIQFGNSANRPFSEKSRNRNKIVGHLYSATNGGTGTQPLALADRLTEGN